jgi:tRNA dimethylallyltransferase
MDVGTAKPTAAERAEVPHHLLDIADPSDDFSVAQFQQAATAALAGIEARGHRALLVGGTGLYLQAVVDWLTMPGAWPAVRADLEARATTTAGVGALYRQLAEADPPAAARIEPGNVRRIVRALEVIVGSGRRFSSFGPGMTAFPATAFRLAGVWLPRAVVAARIEARYRQQLDEGFVDEVRTLAALPLGLSRTARQALGYRELLDHVAGRSTLDEAIDLAVRRTREFARRQRMWFRRDPRIVWFGAPSSRSATQAGNPLAVLPALLGHWMA